MSKQSAVPEFSPEVERQHVRLDTDEYENVYVVGDVHGCYDELETLLRRLSPSEDDMLVFVGDLVNKGPDSDAVVGKVRRMENAVCVTGNNEQKILDGKHKTDMCRENREYLSSLPVVVSWEDSLAVHGGVLPGKPLRAHSPADLRETRSLYGEGYEGTFWFERYEDDLRVFFGHTVLDAPLNLGNAVGLDTGCVYGGSLTAYDCEAEEFVTVEPEETYRARSRHHIVSTGNL
jgi:serine/threonine protein phosphatase 1